MTNKDRLAFDYVSFSFQEKPVGCLDDKKAPTLWIDGCCEDQYAPGWCELGADDVAKLRDFLNVNYPEEPTHDK